MILVTIKKRKDPTMKETPLAFIGNIEAELNTFKQNLRQKVIQYKIKLDTFIDFNAPKLKEFTLESGDSLYDELINVSEAFAILIKSDFNEQDFEEVFVNIMFGDTQKTNIWLFIEDYEEEMKYNNKPDISNIKNRLIEESIV